MRTVLILIFLIFASNEVSANNVWTLPNAAGKRAKIEYTVCKLGVSMTCLAVACDALQYYLISLRDGAGSFIGKTEIATGSKREIVDFVEDSSLIRIFGVSGSRAKISRELITRMSLSQSIKVRDLTSGEDEFSSKNLKLILQRSHSSCR